jgi:uncharacterized protein YkwD
LGVQDRDWYHEHSRKREQSRFDDTDEAVRQARYDPKQFRSGAKSAGGGRRRAWLFGALLALLLACVVAAESYRSKGPVWRLANDVTRYVQSTWVGSGGETKPAIDQKAAAPCDVKAAAPEAAANQFIKDADGFLLRVAELRVKHEFNELAGPALKAEKDRVERESQALLGFHEKNLRKCFLNKDLEAAVSRRLQAIRTNVKDLATLKSAAVSESVRLPVSPGMSTAAQSVTTTTTPPTVTQIIDAARVRQAGQLEAHISAITNAFYEARRKGCKGRQGTRAPVRRDPGMDRFGELALSGEKDQRKVWDKAKFLAFGGAGVDLDFQTSPRRLGSIAVESMCAYITDPQLNVFGVAQMGKKFHVNVARAFSPPDPDNQSPTARVFLDTVNAARAIARNCGDKYFAAAEGLVLDSRLNFAAKLHAKDAFMNPGLSHEGSDGSSPTDRAKRAGYPFGVGENMTNLSDTPQEAVATLLKSPRHCANIMDPGYREMGVRFYVNSTQMPGIVWVQKLSAGR